MNIQAFSAIDVEVTLAENPETANNTFFIAFATELGAGGNISVQAIEEFTTQREMLPYESSGSSFTSIPTNVFVPIRRTSQPATEESLIPFAIIHPADFEFKIYVSPILRLHVVKGVPRKY